MPYARIPVLPEILLQEVLICMMINEMIASLSIEAKALLAISILWLAGFLMSRVSKVFSLPNVTGYILAGVAIGPHCLNLIPADVTAHMSFVTDAALALIAFGVGRYLRLDILRDQGKKVIRCFPSAAFLLTAPGCHRFCDSPCFFTDDDPSVSCQRPVRQYTHTGGRPG